MTVKEYKNNFLSYMKSNPSELAWEAVADIVQHWTENGVDDFGDLLHKEMYGEPWECKTCGVDNYLPGRCYCCLEVEGEPTK